MIDLLLRRFPAHTYALIVVRDRDALLADEGVLAALTERGYRIIDERDPVRLRQRVEEARPFGIDRPTIVVTAGPLSALPYDLWQSCSGSGQGHRVVLELSDFYPNLAYPVVRDLTPSQRWRLSQAASPARRLGRRASVEYVLRHVFDVDLSESASGQGPGALWEPGRLVAWLNRHHQQTEPMPGELAGYLLERLRAAPAYAGWPLEELLSSREAFAAFVREQWRACLQRERAELVSEGIVRYVARFDADEGLQDAIPGLVRSGVLEPLAVERPDRLPAWARTGVLALDEDRRARRAMELLQDLVQQLGASLDTARWERWQAISRAWAELTALRYGAEGALSEPQRGIYLRAQAQIDGAFVAWLRDRYAPLGSQRLPWPHHVWHAPHWIAYRRRQEGTDRVALLVLDGMALADWMVIGPAWRARHTDWRVEEHLVLAQVPTLTFVSRQALIGGLRPAEFGGALGDNRVEARLWAAFWAGEGLLPEACPCVHLALDRTGPPPEVDSARTRALCLIDHKVDELAHDATLGSADFYASLTLWLEGYGRHVEALIDGLLGRGYVVYLASDHGHVEARGYGRPTEGLTVDTRGQRARVYSDRRAAVNAQLGYETILWGDDGLLPDGVWALLPEGRYAFALHNQVLVTHGGLTLDEVVVPLVEIGKRELLKH